MSEIKLYKNILSAENIFLSSEFSLGFYASFRSKKIGGGCMPSANITTACLGLDWGQSGRSCCFHPGTANACARVEARMGARCACCKQVAPCGVGSSLCCGDGHTCLLGLQWACIFWAWNVSLGLFPFPRALLLQ